MNQENSSKLTALGIFFRGDVATVRYKNWHGETRNRLIQAIELIWGSSKWHPEDQWLLRAVDLETGEERQFAVKDMDPALDTPTA